MSIIAQYKFTSTIDTLPVFNEGFEYTYSDVVNEDGTTIRTIESDSLPTEMFFTNCTGLLEANELATSELNTAIDMFFNCKNLTYVKMEDVENITSFERAFMNCSNLTTIEGNEKWKTYNNTNLGSAFSGCSKLTGLHPGGWEVAGIHAFGACFRGCQVLEQAAFDEVVNWRTSYLQYSSQMFNKCNAMTKLDLSNFHMDWAGDLNQMVTENANLTEINLSNWKLNPELTTGQYSLFAIFNKSNNLKKITIKNTNLHTIKALVNNYLVKRSADDPGIIELSMQEEMDSALQIAASSRNWTIQYEQKPSEYVVAQYSYDKDSEVFYPQFNDGDENYQYTATVSDLYNGQDVEAKLVTIKSFERPVKIKFSADHIGQENADKLLRVYVLNCELVTDFSYMFKGCHNVYSIIDSGFYTLNSTVTDCTSMFEDCEKLDHMHVYRWKTENIISMRNMCKNCASLSRSYLHEIVLNKNVDMEGMFENCTGLKQIRITPELVNRMYKVFPTRSIKDPGIVNINSLDEKDSPGTDPNLLPEVTVGRQLGIKNWHIDGLENNKLDLFVIMGQSNAQGQSETYKDFMVPENQAITYEYLTDSLTQVKHPFGENIQTLGDVNELEYYQLEGAVGCETGLPYGSLSPHFAAKYFEVTKRQMLIEPSCCGASTIAEWLPGHSAGRYDLTVEKVQRSIDAVTNRSGKQIAGKYLVWLQGESDGIYRTGTANYKTRFLQFWNALKEDLGLEKCFIIRVAKFRPNKYNDKPIIEAQEQLAQENDDIELVTRVTGYLEHPDKNPLVPTIQDGLSEEYPYVDHYTWEGYKLVGETAGERIGYYINNGIMPDLEPEPYAGEITSSSETCIVSYKYKGTASLMPTFDKDFDYRIIDTTDENGNTCRRILSNYIPTRISFQAKSNLLEVNYINSSRLNTGYGMFYNCSSLTYVNMPYVSYVATMEGMFNGCTKLQRIEGIEKWNTARNANWGSTFGNCRSLTNLDPRNFILTDAHAMGATFRGCTAAPIENFDFRNWRTPNVQYLSGTFDVVTTVKELDFSGFDVSNVGTLQGFLKGCSSLERVDLSNWILTEKHYNWQGDSDKWNPLSLSNFFDSCSSLIDIKLLNTDRFTAYKISERLPNRTADQPSTIHISMEAELDNELSDLISSKGWNVDYAQQPHEFIVTSYYFDSEIGDVIPVFNDGFEYTYEDSIGLNNYVLRTIKSTVLPTSMHFGIDHVSQDDADSLINVVGIDTSNIEDLSGMFKGCRNIGLIPIGLVTSKAVKLTSMFEGCCSLDLNYAYQWYTENVTDMSYMFKDCTSMTSIGIEELKISKKANIKGMFEGCTALSSVRATPAVFDAIASVLPDRPFSEPGKLTFRTGMDGAGSEADLTCDDELLKHNWLTNRNRHLDLFVMMGQSNMQGQSEIYKEFEVPMYQSCTYLYNKDEVAQVKHPFGENINTLGNPSDLGYYQLEGAVGCETGLPYGSLSPHFAAEYFEQTKTPTLMVPCCCGASTVSDWFPGTTQQRFEMTVEKTQKSIAAVEEIGRTIRGKYLVWLQGESDGYGTGVGSKKSTYKTRFLQFWNAIKAELGFEKCFIIRVHKFRDGYSYNCFPIIDAQEELSLENDDIELVTRITGYLQYPEENPENPTIQHAYQGLQIISNHDHYTWEGYKLVGETAGSRVGQYINTGVMPELEPEPWPDKVTSSSEKIIADYRFNNTVYENYLPQFNSEFATYRIADSVAENIVTRKVISADSPTMIRFGIDCSSNDIEAGVSSTNREQSLLEVRKVNMDNINNAANMFCLCENLKSIPALSFSNISNVNSMFYKCNALTSIDTRNYDLSQTVNADNFMRDCVNLSEIIGYENWNVGNMESMKSLFRNCSQLARLDLSNFAMNNAVDISYIFDSCTGLKSLTLSNWNLEQCTNIENAFGNCDNLSMVIVNNSDYETINKIISALPVKTAENPGYLDVAFSNNFALINADEAKAKHWDVYKESICIPLMKIMNNSAKMVCGGNVVKCVCVHRKRS